MIQFPLKFEVNASANFEVGATWTAQTNSLAPLTCSIPPDFGGPGGGYTPEDLFALSVLNCMIAMFKIFCEKMKLKFEKVKGKAVVTMNQDPGINQISMTEIDITIDVTGADQPEKARQVLEQAIKNCPISNSIKTGKTFHLSVCG